MAPSNITAVLSNHCYTLVAWDSHHESATEGDNVALVSTKEEDGAI